MVTMVVSDVGVLIGAGSTSVVLLGNFAMGVINWIEGRKREAKLRELAKSVDGQSEALNKAIGEGAFAKGKAAGVAAERLDPQVSAEIKK